MALRRARAGFAAGEGRRRSCQKQQQISSDKHAGDYLVRIAGIRQGNAGQAAGPVFSGPHISTGDMLREHISAGDEMGQEAQRLIKAGKLVPDEMVNALVEQRLVAAGLPSPG